MMVDRPPIQTLVVSTVDLLYQPCGPRCYGGGLDADPLGEGVLGIGLPIRRSPRPGLMGRVEGICRSAVDGGPLTWTPRRRDLEVRVVRHLPPVGLDAVLGPECP